MFRLFSAASLVLAVFPSLLSAAIYDVTTTDDGVPGSLRAAITAASASPGADTINLPNGIYSLTAGQLSVSGRVVLQGESSAETIIDCGRRSRAFQISAGASVEISDVTILNGKSNIPADASGGGISVFGSMLLTQCRISSCETFTLAGAIVIGNAPPSAARCALRQCEVTHNRGGDGGAVYNYGHFEAIDTLFDRNSGQQGGVFVSFTAGDESLFINCTISNNTSSNIGGAIYSVANTPANNLIMVNCTLSGNRSASAGGAIFASGANSIARLLNCTVTDNYAFSHSGGVTSSGGCTLTNTVIAGNTTSTGIVNIDIGGEFISNGYNLIGTRGSSVITGNQTGNLVGTDTDPVDAVLSPLTDFGGLYPTCPPLAGSPAIDGGNPAGAVDQNGQPLTRDQRGAPRPQCGNPDIGAVEVPPVTDPEDIITYLLGLSAPAVCKDVNEDHAIDIADHVTLN